jgi:hypothetical protein
MHEDELPFTITSLPEYRYIQYLGWAVGVGGLWFLVMKIYDM